LTKYCGICGKREVPELGVFGFPPTVLRWPAAFKTRNQLILVGNTLTPLRHLQSCISCNDERAFRAKGNIAT
jgi:hypothetical protein